MSYTKHTFVDGESLYAYYLNNMENQIEANSKLVATSISDASATISSIATAAAQPQAVFDFSGLEAGVGVCTVYIDEESKFYKITDIKTGFISYGFYKTTDTIKNLILSNNIDNRPHHYTVRWNQTLSKMERLNDAISITTTTTNFVYSGSINNNYYNPFDKIYPWSGRKLCNIDLDLYMGLTSGDDITDCVTAWENDVNFSYENDYGVWVYTPPFFGSSWISDNYRYFDVTDEKLPNNIFYPASIQGRWLGVDEVLTINGESKHCLLPKIGFPACDITRTNLHQYAKNYGATLMDIYTLDATALLFIVEFANMNLQTALGVGVSGLQANSKPYADVSNSTTITFSGLTGSHLISFQTPNAIIKVGQSNWTYIVSGSTTNNITTVEVADPITYSTSQTVYTYGLKNVADENIGSKSGYIGSNFYCNSYYRGQTFFANRYRYLLGAYRQKDTSKIWIAKKGDCDNYDSLDTSKHINTNLVLPSDSSTTTEGYIASLTMVGGLSFVPFSIELGGSADSNNPVGDYSYIPKTSTDDTILLIGGRAGRAYYCGWCPDWTTKSSDSSWNTGAQPVLKNPS